MPARVSGIGVLAVAGGGLVLYSGVTGKNISSAIRAFLMGQSPSTASTANPISQITSFAPLIPNSVTTAVPTTGTGQAQGTTTAAGRGSGGTTANLSGNQAIVNRVAALYGWGTGTQWQDLVNVINRESGFNNNAQNPSSTAYGMFQFLDSTWATVGATKTSNPLSQAIAGLKYIKQRYGTPAAAWAHEQQFGWY
jgi:transglycosylase-like protein with SLT domain